MSKPIIFIHYGAASYLSWALRTARRTNPDKRIILIGDSTNRKISNGLAEHIPFEELEQSLHLVTFDRVFKVIQGARHRYNKLHGTEFWLRFVFRRWFLIHRLLQIEKIDSFWTFDSDTLILTSLKDAEARFSGYDCTEHCRGRCLNGLINSRNLIEQYLITINELFQTPSYLELQRKRLDKHASLSFNEMDAYCEYRERAQLRTIRASQPIDREVFDDALAFVEDYVTAPILVGNRIRIKQLALHPSGVVYGKHLQAGVVRFLTLNLSWMPIFVFKRLAKMASTSTNIPVLEDIEFNSLPKLNLQEPMSLHLSRFAWSIRKRLSNYYASSTQKP